jgi:hypothetical protein
MQYRFLSAGCVDWKVALKPRGNIILGVKFMLLKENKPLSMNRDLLVNKHKP